jgi:hypothetical protein
MNRSADLLHWLFSRMSSSLALMNATIKNQQISTKGRCEESAYRLDIPPSRPVYGVNQSLRSTDVEKEDRM